MKRLAVITTSLLTALTAFGGTTAYAAESDTIYPQDSDFIKPVAFTSLSDYAVFSGDGGTEYAFAEDKNVFIYGNERLTPYSYSDKITGLDCSDGVFYWSTAEDLYSYENNSESGPAKSETAYEFQPFGDNLIIGNYIYYYDEEGALTVHEKSTKQTTTFEGEYSKLKQYGDKVYAVKQNVLYSFDGAKQNEISLEYADFSSTQKIAVGQAAAGLKNYKLEFVTVQSGAYMTEVDLTSLDGEYFISGKTITAEEDTVALLLCRTGNAEIIAIGDTSYILLASKTKDNTDANCYVNKEFEKATIIGNRIYASPYVIIGTSSVDNAAGTIVSVLNKLEYTGVLGSAYYEVLYLTENGTKVGYVADGFLTEYIIEDNKQPSVVPDPEHNEDNDIITVLLVLAVVVLVLLAIGYLTYVGTRSNKKEKKKEEKKADKKEEK